MFNPENQPKYILIAINLVGLIAVGLALLDFHFVAVQALFALPFALVIPGYALTQAAFPPGLAGFSLRHRVIFIIGLGMALDVIVGLALNWSPWGLQPVSWAISLEIVTFFATLIAWRRQTLTESSGDSSGPASGLSASELRPILLLGLAGLLALGAVVIASVGAYQPDSSFTQLWLLPVQGSPDSQKQIRLGIGNLEVEAMRYRLQLKVQDYLLQEWPLIELKPGDRWETTTSLNLTGLDYEPVDAILYRLDDPGKIYRLATLRAGPSTGATVTPKS